MKKTKYIRYEQRLNSCVFFTNTNATNSSMFQMNNNKRNVHESVEASDTSRARARATTMREKEWEFVCACEQVNNQFEMVGYLNIIEHLYRIFARHVF